MSTETTKEITRPDISQMDYKDFQAYLEEEPPVIEPSETGEYFHVPIAYLEPDLRHSFCGDISFKVKQFEVTEGMLFIVVRIKAFHPILKKYLKYDGVSMTVLVGEGSHRGTTKIQSADFLKPEVAACYSEAIKNGAKKIGKRFGSDINRVVKPGKQNVKEVREQSKKAAIEDRYQVLIDDAETIEDLNKIISTMPQTPEIQDAFNKRLIKIKKTLKSKK